MRQHYIVVKPSKKYQARQISKEEQEELMIERAQKQSLMFQNKKARKVARQTVHDKVIDKLFDENQDKFEEDKQQSFYDEEEVRKARVSFIQEQ